MSSSRPYSVSSSSMVPPDLSLRAPPPPRPVQNRKQNKTAVPLRQAAAGKNPSPAARDYSIAISRRTVMRHCTAYYTLSRKCVGGPAPGIFALRIFSNYQHVARAQVGGHFAIRAPQGGHRGVVLTGNAGEGFSRRTLWVTLLPAEAARNLLLCLYLGCLVEGVRVAATSRSPGRSGR